VGAPWTLLVYMINQQSPKKNVKENFFEDDYLINRILIIIEKFLKIHIKKQVENGANVIQIFDSWAGLLEERDYPNYIYTPTLKLVDYVKSLNIPAICFPRNIKNYKEFCEIVKPDAVNIDYNVDPLMIRKNIKIPVQGGLDPKILLTDQKNLKKEILKYLDIFKDHPYIFNLGHGILPETKPEMVEFLIKTIKEY
jgi:uroporphyrinogen decarboxylase